MSLQINISTELNDIAAVLARSMDYIFGARLPGDIAEFGTYWGDTSSVIAYVLVSHHKIQSAKKHIRAPLFKKFHMFDSFQGMPDATAAPDLIHPAVRVGAWAPGTCTGLSAEKLRTQINGFGLGPGDYAIHDGWFTDTVGALAAETKFAMLHVDCDLYQSTMDALEPLFARGMVSQGAVILFDDWNSGGANDALGERAAWRELVDRYDISFEPIGFYAAMGYRLFVKSYRGMT
jgi:hypothetical protein